MVTREREVLEYEKWLKMSGRSECEFLSLDGCKRINLSDDSLP